MAIKTSQWLACLMLLSMTSAILAARVSKSMQYYDEDDDDDYDKAYDRDFHREYHAPPSPPYKVCQGLTICFAIAAMVMFI